VDAGEVTNIADGSASDPAGGSVTDSDSNTVTVVRDPSIDILKDWNLLVDADNSETVTEGDTIEYTFVVTNDGNVTLADVTVTDQLSGLSEIICTPAQGSTLLPSETMACSATYVVTEADVLAGVINNTATASSGDTNTSDDSGLVTVPVDKGFQGCVYTQGYWRTHNTLFSGPGNRRGGGPKPDATWDKITNDEGTVPLTGPGAEFLNSSYTYYQVLWNKDIDVDKKWLILARQYIAAELNEAQAGDITTVDEAVEDGLMATAENLLNAYFDASYGSWEPDKAIRIAGILDDYNNGVYGGDCE
jgi:uncharacterized repeat protein (TIGR01451 family)